jgi:hypothetical protein
VNTNAVQITTTGTVPTGLAINTKYFVVSVSGDTFKLATTYNGTAINITAQGTGNHTIFEAGRTYKSTGENSNRIPEYINIYTHISATTIYFRTHYKYDSVTKLFSGSSIVNYSGYVTTNQTGFYIWLWGNKNLVFVGTKVVSTYYRIFFGWLKPFFTLQTDLTDAATSGNSAVLTVTSTVGFEVGYSYQIVGAALEGRDTLVITEITNSTSMKVSNLPSNYSSGSLIGIAPSIFGNYYGGNGAVAITCADSASALDTAPTSNNSTTMLPIADVDPDFRTSKYVLQPFVITKSGSSIIGYMDENMLSCSTAGLVIEDTFAVGRLDSGTSTGTNSITELNDTSKSWTVNAYANKVVIITFGLGSGMIKKIISNTATKLTISSDYVFETIPDNTSQYIICDEGYRFFASGTGAGTADHFALREGI